MSRGTTCSSKVVSRTVVRERSVKETDKDGKVIKRVTFLPTVEKTVRTFLWSNPELRRAFREAKEREEKEQEARKKLRK